MTENQRDLIAPGVIESLAQSGFETTAYVELSLARMRCL